MKTRQEMVYDFMLALAPNFEQTYAATEEDAFFVASTIKCFAELLADEYLRSLG